jgi:hypothetical protein
VITSRRPLTTTFAIGLLAVFGLSACQSQPSAQRVARDLVETLTLDHPEIGECMLDVVADYDLNTLGDDANSDNAEVSGPAIAELDEFEAELAACDPEGVTRTSAP